MRSTHLASRPIFAPIGSTGHPQSVHGDGSFVILHVIHADRHALAHVLPHLGADSPQPRIPVAMIRPFLSLSVALQAVVLCARQLRHLPVTDRMVPPTIVRYLDAIEIPGPRCTSKRNPELPRRGSTGQRFLSRSHDIDPVTVCFHRPFKSRGTLRPLRPTETTTRRSHRRTNRPG